MRLTDKTPAQIQALVAQDFGIVVDIRVAAMIKRWYNSGMLIWTSRHIIAVNGFRLDHTGYFVP